ncbi:type I restriction endonuclease subunit R [Maricaulis maris]|uniref:type I restriction endonuclease subunit R n=1 Tax=Maricaulis maris TaxID=74318 RepID=UPI003B8BEFE3
MTPGDDDILYPEHHSQLSHSGWAEDDLVKKAAMDLLAGVGWRDQDDLMHEWAGDTSSEGRRSMREVVLVDRLQPALVQLNPDMPEIGIEKAIEVLTEDRRAMPPVDAAQAFHKLLKAGVKVEVPGSDGGFETRTVRVIDWQSPEANHFFAATEFWVKGELYNRRADVVGFVNGLPLLFMELKAPHESLKKAYDDNLTAYRTDIPQLLTPNAIAVLTNGTHAKLGSAFAPWSHFYEWKKVDREDEEPKVSLERLIRGVATPERLLDLIENFTVFETDRGGLVKKVAKNHQYLGVNNAVEAVAGLDETNRQLGVFWHTQGSGKSLSMAFFAGKVLRTMPGSWTFVLVTDRTELDEQIYKTFAACGLVTETEAHAGSVAELRQLLQEDHRFVFTLIHKFQTKGGEPHPVLSERSDIIVVTDEAHRSQYDTLALNMRRALPNAAFLGFTGTPLMAGEELTKGVFGDYVSIYNFTQSIEDGATVPLYYENRIPELQLDQSAFNDEVQGILEAAELDEDQEKELERKLGRDYHLITRPDRLKTIAEDLVEHFLGRSKRDKAMMVCIDKATAVRMYDNVQTVWAERTADVEARLVAARAGAANEEADALADELEVLQTTDMAVVVSSAQNEAAELAKKGLDIVPHRVRMRDEKLDEKFKDPDDPLRLVFVCAMWITGFDAPSISTVYLDKPMRNHTLMQTIARANRTLNDKQAGFIVDYVGVFRNLQLALAIYGQPTGGGDSPIVDKAELLAHLAVLIEEVREYCLGQGADLDGVLASAPGSPQRLEAFAAAYDALVSPGDVRGGFMRSALDVIRVYKAILPDERAAPFAPMGSLLSALVKRLRAEVTRPDVDTVMGQIEALLDETISAEDYRLKAQGEQPLLDLSQVDFDALREKFAGGRKRSEAERLRALLERKVQAMAKLNKSRLDLVKKLEAMIERYNSGSQNIESWFEDLVKFAQELTEEEGRTIREGLSEEELAIFDILTQPEPVLTDKEREQVKSVAKDLLAKLKSDKLVLDWWKRQQTRSAVQSLINRTLGKSLPETPFTDEIYNAKCELAYAHVYEAYGGAGREVYGE